MKIDTYQERLARIKTIPDLHNEVADAKRTSMKVRLHAKSRIPLEHRHSTALLKMYPELNALYSKAKAVEQKLQINFLRIKANLREGDISDPIPKNAICHIRRKARSYFHVLGKLPSAVTFEGCEYKSNSFMAFVSDISTTSYQ
ncbi:hypothetical protein [Pseudoalteromonas sp. MelDa3]|uniref:hypothetical protein n=1 Tax=Pseudoalteromonas sp. MelDa3 TaxID=888435 RepID=UPI000CB99B2F|nr:hypothetical protein [Pseudoalteromonas sp. MelDa3]PLT25107.1 hypothetical protein CXF89_12220 [Pseudoalteromonas sp. MelDa3]